MKYIYKIITITVMVGFIILNPNVNAQDNVLIVEWVDPTTDTLITNPLFRAIQGDTLEDGSRNKDRIYKLRQGGFYYITEPIQNDGWHLRIEGEAGDPGDEFANPPMLQIGARNDGSSPGKMFNIRGSFDLSNVIVNGKTTLGSLPYEIIDVRADDSDFRFDNVIFEFAQWGIIGFYSRNADIYFEHNKFRNLLSENQPWGGRGFSVWADADTIWVENNTFHNVGGFSMQVEGATANYMFVNHNTFINNGRQIILGHWVKELYFVNNIVLNGFWQGEDVDNISSDRGDDEQYAGMIALETLPSQYGLDLQRRILISNNAWFSTQTYNDFYSEDKVRKQPLLNVKTQNLIDANENMIVQDNYFDEHDPGFAVYADNDQEHIDFISDLRSGASDVRLNHYWDPGRDLSDNESIAWPLPEDLALMGGNRSASSPLWTHGVGSYPIGDLNWLNPGYLEGFKNDREALYEEIRNKLGGIVTVEYTGSTEAESGSYGASGSTLVMDDKFAARVAGGGIPEWNFDLTAGTYDVEIKHRTWYADNNPGRATNLVVNGGSAQTFTIGIEITNDLPWAYATVDGVQFEEGSNNIRLERNWGWMEYESVTLKQNGEVVKTLYASAAILNDATLECGGSLCASGDALADISNGGSVVVPASAENAGQYTVKMFYLVPGGGDASANISVNGGDVISVNLSAEDSTLTEAVLNGINMSAGENTIAIINVSGNLAIDNFDFFIVNTATSSEFANDIANKFQLYQNYPNPFNPSTNISFTLPKTTNVQLEVYNMLGQKVATLINGRRSSGSHTVRFNTNRLASGVYIYRLRADNISLQRKMTLIK